MPAGSGLGGKSTVNQALLARPGIPGQGGHGTASATTRKSWRVSNQSKAQLAYEEKNLDVGQLDQDVLGLQARGLAVRGR